MPIRLGPQAASCLPRRWRLHSRPGRPLPSRRRRRPRRPHPIGRVPTRRPSSAASIPRRSRWRRTSCRSPQLKLPKGFKIEVFMPAASPMRARCGSATRARCSSATASSTRSMPWSRRTANARSRVIASGLDRPNGLAFHNGTLYIAEGTKISKLEKIEDNLDNPPKPVVIYDRIPEPPVARLEIHGARARQQALCQCRRAVQYLRAARRPTLRSGASISTAAARKRSCAACATRSASTGIR